MFEPIKISPSILSADFMNMEKSIREIEEGGADMIHIDVMDGHFVPNITLGVPFVAQIRKLTSLPLDVHLMVSNPLEQLPWFIDAGADIVNFHIEPYSQEPEKIENALQIIENAGKKAALTCKPESPIAVLTPYISSLYMVLIMSVNPGFSGQSYIEGSEQKVAELVNVAHRLELSPLIQVDGGIGVETAARVSAKGADVLVAGNAIFKATSVKKAIEDIRKSADQAQYERRIHA